MRAAITSSIARSHAQVARSAIADHRRAAARHGVPGDPQEDDLPAPEPDDDGAAERELATYVTFFIAMLPAPYREALTLTELEGLTQKEAGEMLGPTARRLLLRGLSD